MIRARLYAPLLALALLTLPPPAQAQLGNVLKRAKQQLAQPTASATTGGAASPYQPSEPLLNGRDAVGLGELVVTNKRPASFQDAKANAVQEVSDGDDVWVALRLTQPLKTYAEVSAQSGVPQSYKIQLEVTPAKGGAAYRDCFWYLLPSEAEAREIILSLSPVMAREVKENNYTVGTKTNCWLETVADDDSKAGRWNNRIGMKSMHQTNGVNQQFIASTPLTANVPNGFPKWNATLHRSQGGCNPRTQAKIAVVLTCPR